MLHECCQHPRRMLLSHRLLVGTRTGGNHLHRDYPSNVCDNHLYGPSTLQYLLAYLPDDGIGQKRAFRWPTGHIQQSTSFHQEDSYLHDQISGLKDSIDHMKMDKKGAPWKIHWAEYGGALAFGLSGCRPFGNSSRLAFRRRLNAVANSNTLSGCIEGN